MLEDGAGGGVEPPAAGAAGAISGPRPRWARLSGRRTPGTPKGFVLPIWICHIRRGAHPEGLSPNKDPGGRPGEFSVWLGRAWHSKPCGLRIIVCSSNYLKTNLLLLRVDLFVKKLVGTSVNQ